MSGSMLKSVNDCNFIRTNGKDVLISGRNLWLFRKDGTFVTKYKNIRHVRKAEFLPNDTAFVDAYKAYHYISLSTGEILWSSPKKGVRTMVANRFAVSKDALTVYDLSYINIDKLRIDCICPSKQKHNQYTVTGCLSITNDIFCDEDGILCAMQFHSFYDDNVPCSRAPERVEQYGVLAIPVDENSAHPYWKSQWKSEYAYGKEIAGCDGRYILREDYSVLDLDKGEEFRILSENDILNLPKTGFCWTFDSKNKYLTVSYLGALLNAVVDCEAHKIVSIYKRSSITTGFEGCLIDNEFWVGTENGVIKRPFPNWD